VTFVSADEAPASRVRELLAVYGDPRASAARLLCDVHPADAVAYTIVEPDLRSAQLKYGQLRECSERFAASLAGLGVRPGDRVATLMGKSREYLITVLGIWRLGAVHVPLFTAFAPPAIALRLLGCGAAAVVCDGAQRGKLDSGEDIPPGAPWRVIVADPDPGSGSAGADDLDFAGLLAAHEPGIPAAALGGDAPIVHIYTSGTTGRPKGVVVPAVALAGFHAYAEFGCDVRAGDVFWNAADPGWAYGLYFGVMASLALGVPSMLLHAGFSADLTFQAMSRYGVTNFTAAPTVYRSLRASGIQPPPDLKLRCASSAGEPLTPDVNQWAEQALGVQVRDHYGQTEAGMLINNHHHAALRRPLKPGSMGQPMPGWTVRVLREDDQVAPPGTPGRIAVDTTASPLAWFGGYSDDPAKSAGKFGADGRWYLTGDVGSVDEDGYFHFSARDDDVIIMAGYRIGPFEVESVLASHPAVAECAVIAVPDTIRGEVLQACIVTRDPAAAGPDLARELQELVRRKFAAHAYPRAVRFLPALPKTPSGKIQRYVLRQQHQAEPGPVSS
jgi:acetyl-CoA synthetase